MDIPTAWKIYINGKDTGIIETNYNYAFGYWRKREIETGKRIKLVPIQKEN